MDLTPQVKSWRIADWRMFPDKRRGKRVVIVWAREEVVVDVKAYTREQIREYDTLEDAAAALVSLLGGKVN